MTEAQPIFQKILVPVDGTGSDQAILGLIRRVARVHGSQLILLHVADGFMARLYRDEADSLEIKGDRRYLGSLVEQLRSEGFKVEAELSFGDPAAEILEIAEKRGCDLIAMSTHGHRFISDLLYGSTVHFVRHRASVPVLLLKAPR